MENILLAAHVLAGILFVGPVAVTTSLFPRFAPQLGTGAPQPVAGAPQPVAAVPQPVAGALQPVAGAQADAVAPDAVAPGAVTPDAVAPDATATVLHRITRVYGILALIVPVIGLVLAAVQGRLGEVWITIAMVLTAVAGGLLALRIMPAQRDALAGSLDAGGQRTMRVLTGVFNLLWAAVVVLMIVRPGAE